MTTKRQGVKKVIILSSKKKGDHEIIIENRTDSDQVNDKYLLQFWEIIEKKQQITKIVHLLFHSSSIHSIIIIIKWDISIMIIEKFWHKINWCNTFVIILWVVLNYKQEEKKM